MTLQEFEIAYKKACGKKKTKAVDTFNKKLIKEGVDVSFLKDMILDRQEYHRTYFQVSMGLLKTVEEKLEFIEQNFDKLWDWWHVDQLSQFVDKYLEFDYVYAKAKEYINNPHPFARRWGYVIFMPSLVKDSSKAADIFRFHKSS